MLLLLIRISRGEIISASSDTGQYYCMQGECQRIFAGVCEFLLAADITALTEEGRKLAPWALEAWANVTGI